MTHNKLDIKKQKGALAATTYFRGKPTIIGLGIFHFCVRDGNRWDNASIVATKAPFYYFVLQNSGGQEI